MTQEEFAEWMSRCDVGFLQMMYRYWELQKQGMIIIDISTIPNYQMRIVPRKTDGIMRKPKAPISEEEFLQLMKELKKNGLAGLFKKE